VLYTLVYGRIIAEHVDPVEKKPLLHFYPGSNPILGLQKKGWKGKNYSSLVLFPARRHGRFARRTSLFHALR
jgi:hypothetical protein